jgi:hypothetical protein
MGFLDLIGKISNAVERSLESITPKRFKLNPEFVSSLSSNIITFLAGGQTKSDSWAIQFPIKLSQQKFLEELKSNLKQEGVKFTSGENFIQTEKGKLSFVGAKLTLENIEMKNAEKKSEGTFVRLSKPEARQYLRESFEKEYEPPMRGSKLEQAYEARFTAFQNKYIRHVMAASDGLKSGIKALGAKPESAAWEFKISVFISGYCDNLIKFDKQDILPPGAPLELTLKSRDSATKFKKAFESEVSATLGIFYPVQIAIQLGGSFKEPVLIVAAKAPKVQKVKDIEPEKAVRGAAI